jgi:hypothetical protein
MNIELTRGDSKSITVIIKQNGIKVSLVTGDKIYFSVKRKQTQTEYDIQKEVTTFSNGEAIINLLSTDTTINEGLYLYDIQYNKASGEVYTIVKGNLTVTKGITE